MELLPPLTSVSNSACAVCLWLLWEPIAEQKDCFQAVRERCPPNVSPKRVTNGAQASKCSVVIVFSWVILKMVHHPSPGAGWHTHIWYTHVNMSGTRAHRSARRHTLPHLSPVRPITHRLNNWNCHSCQCQPYCHGRMATAPHTHTHTHTTHSSLCLRTDLFSTILYVERWSWHDAGCVLVRILCKVRDWDSWLDDPALNRLSTWIKSSFGMG